MHGKIPYSILNEFVGGKAVIGYVITSSGRFCTW